MAQSYTRQSSMSDGDTITAALFNDEYNQLVNAFTYSSSSASSTGHRHDGTAGHGGNIHTIGDLDFLNKIVADSTNNRWGFFVEVSSAAVEQIRIQDGAIVPVTDNDIDLGTSSLEFKDAYFDGTVTTDLLTVSGTTNLDGAIQVDNTITVGVDDTGYDVKFFGDTASAYMLWDTSADDLVLAGAAGLDVAGDIDVDGTSNLDNTDIDGTLAVDGTTISLDATTSLNIDNSNTSNGITIGTATSGVPVSIGHTTSEVTVNDNLTVTGTLTLGSGAELTEAELEMLDGITAGTVAASKAVVVDSNKDAASFRNITLTGELDAATLDISGDADIDGTLEADAITVDGTALNEYIADTVGAMVSSNTESGITVAYEDGDNTLDFTVGTLNQDTTGTADNITVSANNSTDETVYPIFVDGATGSQGAESDTGLTYNPSSGLLTISGELDAGSLDISGNADIDGTLEADAITVDGTALNEYIADTVGAMVSSNTETNITVTYEDGDNTLDFVIGTLNQDTTGNAATFTATANNSTDETVYPVFVDGATGSQGAETDTGLTYNPSSGLLTTTLLAGTLNTAAQGNVTSLGTLTTLTVDNVIVNGTTIGHTDDTDLMTLADGVLTVAGELDATSLDISGNADIDGTLEADAITVDGTALNEYIADTVGAMVGSNTETGITVTYEDGDNTLDFVIGTLNQDTTGTASKVVVTDSTANTNFPVVFNDESNALLDDTGALRYNPSTGTLLVPNLSVAGTTTTVDTVTMEAQNAIIFEGATADSNETTLSIVDPTSDHTQYLINQGGYIPVLAAATTTAITATPAELNILDGVTSTAAELNILDGVTSTAAELNILDGATVVVGELNYLDLGSTAVGTAIASKAVVLDSNKDYTGLRNLTITGELDAATLDISGDVDIDGTLETDNLTVGGSQGSDGQVLTSTGSGVAWEDASGGGGASAVNDLSDAKTFGTSSIMIGDATTGTISGANYNVGLGIDVFEDLTTGDNNVGVGFRALYNLTTGEQNVSLGNSTLMQLTTASNNTAVGQSALNATTSGAGNVAVGHEAMDANTTGGSNTAVGQGALGANTTGEYNTAIGRDALLSNTTASNNTAIGTSSLDANTTGDHNVGIGAGTLGALTTATNNVAIGRDALTASNASENVSIGAYSMDANTTGGNNVAVGYNVLGANTTGAQNTAIGHTALDANTTASDNTAMGYGSLGANTTGASNAALGTASLDANTTGDSNSAVGHHALGANTTGSNNTAMGYGALEAATTAGDNTAFGTAALASTNNTRNLGIGYRALTAQSGSSDNLAIGYDALVRQTTGANGNIAIGNYAGRAVVSSASTSQLVAIGHSVASNASGALAGYQNTFVGWNIASASGLAGAFQNTALGGSTLTDLTSGDHNVAIGYNAGNSITTAGENVFIGSSAGEDITTGVQNVAIGRECFMDATTASESVAVGFQALENATGGSNTSIGYKAGEDITSGTNNFFVGKETGRSNSPGGSITTGNNEGVLGNANVSKINVQVSLTVASDERDKTDFQPLTAGLDFVNGLTPYTYYWDKRHNYVDWNANPDTDLNSITHDGTHKEDWMDLGFKAQEVIALEESINHKLSNKTNLVSNQSGDGKQYQLQYEKFVPILVKALQEADDKIDALTARVAALES